MARALIPAITVLTLIVAGCSGGDESTASAADWASLCTGLERQELPAAGSFAFPAPRRAGSELVVTDLSTSRSRRLTAQRSPHDAVGSIAWSPGGERIAYSAGKGGWNDDAYSDIWVVSASGGRPLRLTDSYEDDWNPTWSPDGTMLAFDRNDDGYNWVYVVDADGTGLRRLTANFNWSPVWTPDGRISYVNTRGVWVMNADGSGKQSLARAPVKAAAWSPDGARVAFTTGSALWVMSANGAERRKVYADPDRETRSPIWSPDSRSIAWTQGDGDLEIFVARRDGTGLRNITDNEKVSDEGPSWSPDGRKITFLRTCESPKHRVRVVPVVVSAEGGEPRRSGIPVDAVWSPSP